VSLGGLRALWRLALCTCLVAGAAIAALPAVSQTTMPVATTGLLDFSANEQAQIMAHGPWPPAPRQDASNRVETQTIVAQWGASLFFDRRLSGNGQLSCASCHQPNRAFQDGLTTAVGRLNGIRNTPSLLDGAQARWLGWGGTHDSLWSASLTPLLTEGEMHQTVRSLSQRLRDTPELANGYRAAFQQEPPADDATLAVDVAKALAAYQATLVSPRNTFDNFRDALARGDTQAAATYPLPAQRGLRLFIGEGRCTVCHAGPRFSNGEFGDIGIPFFVPGGVDAGRYYGLQQLLRSDYNRLGRFNDAGAQDPRAVGTRHVILEPRHFGEFKVPGLRQLTQTAPYMHNGSLPSIEAVVQHYSEFNEDRLHADGERILRPLHLSAEQAADLAAFLRSLSR
jgi:cytochrome c peroxidase